MRSRIVRCAVLAVAAAAACADFAREADRVPAALEIAPGDTMITAGDTARLTVRVFDQEGGPIRLPSWAPPTWTVSDPLALEIAPSGELNALRGGDLAVAASVAGLDVETRLRVNPRSVLLTAPVIYLNQVIQNPEASVPLIAGRPALLRVFVTGDQISFYAPPHVRATLYLEGEAVLSEMVEPGSDLIQTEVHEDRIDLSYDVAVPGELIRPGLELVVELDTEDVVPKSPGSEPRIPAEGRMPLNVIEMPVLDQTFVPTLLTWDPDERVFDWTRGLNPESQQVQITRTLLPVGEMEIAVHDTFETDSDLRTHNGWLQYLREVEVLWNMEGRKGYYYGVVQLPQGSRWGGYGYYDGRHVSVGATRASTYAHEMGHNMTLRHAPCGEAGSPDPRYPYEGGSTGMWGYDFVRGVLVAPGAYKDLMGYCSPDWVSDYHFVKAMDHRLAVESAPAYAGQPERTLMLWGSASADAVFLEPAFWIEAVADVRAERGPYRLEGLGPGGELRFAFGFTPNPVDHGGAHFLFNVPYDPERDGALGSVVLSGPSGEFTLGPSSTPPIAIVRDRATGQIRAIRRDWEGGGARPGGDIEIMVSEGLPGGVR